MNKKIKKFLQFIKENTSVDFFGVLYEKAPKKLRELIDSTKGVEQNPTWHSEGDVYTHIRLVTNRLCNAYPNDKNLLLAGFFHDLGKVETTEWNEEKQSWTARGHEDVSVIIVDEYKSWIEDMGGDFDAVKEIVANHMRIKYLEEMRTQAKIELVKNPYFEEILKFNTADCGGTSLECKPLLDISNIENEMSEFKKKEEEKKIMNSKFNGDIIMQSYPHLTGIYLGNAISNFKKYIIDEFNIDFKEYVLKNSKESIFTYFDKFINDKYGDITDIVS